MIKLITLSKLKSTNLEPPHLNIEFLAPGDVFVFDVSINEDTQEIVVRFGPRSREFEVDAELMASSINEAIVELHRWAKDVAD